MAAGAAVDVVVVGGGTAGCVVASRLTIDHELRVVLIERGDTSVSHHPVDLFESMARPGAMAMTPVTFAGNSRSYATASILGGGSAVNGLAVMTGDAEDYDDWEGVHGAHGWSWAHVSQEFSSLRVVPENARRSDFGPIGRALLQAGVGAQPATLSTHAGQRVSSDSAYLRDALNSGRLTVRGATTVRRVVCENDVVVAVECTDGTVIPTSTAVLCAGALVTPRLLVASGIDHPELGRGLQDHPSFMFPIRLTAESDAVSPATAVARISSGIVGSRPLDGQVIAYEYIDPSREWAGVSVMLVDVYSRGSIVWTPDSTSIDIGAFTDARDVNAMRALVRETARMLTAGSFGEAFCDDEGTPASHLLGLDDRRMDEWIRRFATPVSHVSCTCSMGEGKPLDERGRFRGVQGLWVADSSVMPRIVRGNTNLPTTMIAWRISGFLGEQLRPSR